VLAGWGQNRCGREPARGDHGAACAQRRQRGCHEAVIWNSGITQNDTSAWPAGNARRSCGRGHEVALPQRDLLRPARRSARMQDKRDILRAARLERALERRAWASASSSGAVPSRPDADHDDPGGRAAAVAAAAPLAGISISRGDVGPEELVLDPGSGAAAATAAAAAAGIIVIGVRPTGDGPRNCWRTPRPRRSSARSSGQPGGCRAYLAYERNDEPA